MRPNWRDLAATVLTGLVVAGYAAFLAGADLPLIASVRGMAVAVLVTGMVGCAVGGAEAYRPGTAGWSRRATGVASVVGAAALFAAITALITASGAALAVLVGATVALWVVATLRHALTPRTGGSGSPDPREARLRHPVGHG
jgi:hypothetical protein